MDLHYSPEELAFRDEVRAFIKAELPADIRDRVVKGQFPTKDDLVRWHRILNKKGWAVPTWPKEYGGTGWDAVRHYIFREELHRGHALEPVTFNSNMVGPVIAAFGSEEQKKWFLPKVANVDIWFCQGFSEPGAGSDLASLRTRAVQDGDDYVINGQKIWTSAAHYADWMFCLVRTDPVAKKQKGISYLLIDMKTPGITVRPIKLLDSSHHTNEVFFDNVRVPIKNRIGEENAGWGYAKFLLGNERVGIARVGLIKERVRHIKEMGKTIMVEGKPLAQSQRFRERVAAFDVELKALEITSMRMIDQMKKANKNVQDPKTSILKMKSAELQQATTELLLEMVGPDTLRREEAYFNRAEPPVGPEWAATAAHHYFQFRPATVYGGTNEIQRNILAKAILGL